MVMAFLTIWRTEVSNIHTPTEDWQRAKFLLNLMAKLLGFFSNNKTTNKWKLTTQQSSQQKTGLLQGREQSKRIR